MKSGNLNFLEPSGPLQACNGTALPLPLPYIDYKYSYVVVDLPNTLSQHTNAPVNRVLCDGIKV